MTLPGSTRTRILALLAAPLLLYMALFAYRTVKWKLWVWLPDLVTADRSAPDLPDEGRHLIFLVTDHYEPGAGEAGTERSRRWLEGYRPIADRFLDAAGNRVQYSWFYPFEHGNDDVLVQLGKMVHEGYGEIELHWHHPQFSNETFPDSLDAALEWFGSYGALVSSGPVPETNFGFIHGNWALDNSLPFCGVDRELEILQGRGCYGDFTFSTIGTVCQPKTINTIYFAHDTPGPKSYDRGVRARVGSHDPSGFMIFQGPMTLDWLRVRPEYGAIGEAEPTAKQIHQWIDADIHVEGRPEWVFVKAYAHGIQTRTIDSGAMEGTLEHLEAVSAERGFILHYVTAREAYNLVRAAEDSKTGDPEEFRDYVIAPPANRFFHTEVPVKIERVTADEAVFTPLK